MKIVPIHRKRNDGEFLISLVPDEYKALARTAIQPVNPERMYRADIVAGEIHKILDEDLADRIPSE